jgi:trk system potassium uptake protein TrkH
MNDASKLLPTEFMYIGGSPGSTAGGVKTTTVAVLVISAASQIRGRRSSAMLGRRLPADAPRKAAVVVLFNLSLILGAAFVICLLQPLPLADVLIETTSAVSTVGVTAGLTRALGPVSRYVVLILMYFGRVGSLSFASALAERKAPPPVTDPEEELIIG